MGLLIFSRGMDTAAESAERAIRMRRELYHGGLSNIR